MAFAFAIDIKFVLSTNSFAQVEVEYIGKGFSGYAIADADW